MKKAVVLGERKAGLVDAPDPRPKENWVLVKVHAAPMCAEYKGFLAGRQSEFLGHEAAGEVVAVAQPGRVKVGDRVVVMPQYPCGKCALCVAGDFIHCTHGYDFEQFIGTREGSATMAQYLLKPDWLLPAIPDGVSYEHASLACCALGPSFGAFDAMHLGRFDTVLITGLGPVGLGAVLNAHFRGARVIGVETVAWRAQHALELGAEVVLDPSQPDVLAQVLALTGGQGPDQAIDCSGSPRAHRLCLNSVRRKGRVAFVGECHDETALRVSPDMIRKGLTVIGAWHYNLSLFGGIMQVIQQSPGLDALISHVVPMSDIQGAFELSASHASAKIILLPWL